MAYLEMKGITKVFPGVVANDDVSFAVERSSIHALVGENGAGKTTLMRVLYGMYKPEAGEIFLDGRQADISSPHDSIELGIGMVHQEFQLVPSLTVAENIVLGYEPHKGIWLDKQTTQAQVSEISERFGLHVDPDMPIREIPVGVQQRVEILKLLYRQAELLILDEPTAVLTPQEVESFFQVLKRLCSQGHTIILITHKLKEVISICNYATVLRRGVNVGTVEVAKSSKAEIASLMVGREVEHIYQKEEISSPVPKLICEDVSALDDRRLPALRSISFTVNAGEILGIAGVEGNGQSELLEVLAGQRQAEGKITLDGDNLSDHGTRFIRETGVALIPESRKTQGLNLQGKVSENLVSNTYYQPPFSKYGILSIDKISKYGHKLIQRFDIRTESPNAVAATLSGGNAQKIIIARELADRPEVLVAAHPTRGLDISATQFVHEEMLGLRAQNVAVLLISADLDELLALADRILVLFEGRFVGEVDPKTVTYERLGLLMAGHVNDA